LSSCNERRGILPVAPNRYAGGKCEAMGIGVTGEIGLFALIQGLADFNRSRVYFLYREGVVVYVGQAVNVRRRVADHIGEGVKDFDAVSFIPFAPDKLLAAEARYIRRLRPALNKALNSAAAGWTMFGSFSPSEPLTKSALSASEAAARLGVPVEQVLSLWHANGYRPKRFGRSKGRGFCPIDCDELAQKLVAARPTEVDDGGTAIAAHHS